MVGPDGCNEDSPSEEVVMVVFACVGLVHFAGTFNDLRIGIVEVPIIILCYEYPWQCWWYNRRGDFVLHECPSELHLAESVQVVWIVLYMKLYFLAEFGGKWIARVKVVVVDE